MAITRLQDKLYLGFGKAARHVAGLTDAYRPAGRTDPLDKSHRFLRLHAHFCRTLSKTGSGSGYGHPIWQGIFDGSYTRAGDYLASQMGVFFIAAQDPISEITCVLTNRILSVSRPNQRSVSETNSYGGFIAGDARPIVSRFPACVLTENRSASSGVNLPTDEGLPFWSVMLPIIPDVLFNPGDLLSDDLGRNAVITATELTNMGWRLSAKMTAA